MTEVDTILNPSWLVPIVPQETVWEGCGVAIDKGEIVDVGAAENLAGKYSAASTVVLDDCVLMPGFVNAHTHAAMSLFRGYADDMPLMEWLTERIWPAEAKWVNRSFIEAGSDLACAEMISGGTTCFNDMYFFPDVVAQRAERAGIRACVGMIVIDFPTVWAKDADEYFNKGLAMRDEIRHSNLVTTCFAPHAPHTVSDRPLEKIATLSEELDCQVHIHLHETEYEVNQSMARHAMRPIERLDQFGLLGPQLIAVHMTQLLDGEIDAIANRGVSVVHCPESNLKLAGGFCPVDKINGAGVNLAIGTDGASSNNDLDMLAEMRTASLLAKGVSRSPAALNAFESLKAATLNGAKALGLESLIGSIEVGKKADLISIDLSECSTQPVFNPVSQVAYAAVRSQVSNVWVNGRRLLENFELTTIDKYRTCQIANEWHNKIKS